MAHSSDSHVRSHPLLVPENLNVLGPFLETKSLLCSLRVCKTWHRVLEPHLWHTVRFARQDVFVISSIFGGKVPARTLTPIYKSYSPEALVRNLQHIHALYFSHHASQDQQDPYSSSSSSSSSSPSPPSPSTSDLELRLLQCRSLTMLELHNLSDEMVTLLEHNRNTIQRIVYHSHSFNVLRQKPIWDILGSMPRLRHLELQSFRKDSLHLGQNPSQGEAFAKICERLETLHLIFCTLDDWPSFEQGGQEGRFSKMKQLEFMSVNDASAQLQMISQCPVLEDLTWCPQQSSSFPTQDSFEDLLWCPQPSSRFPTQDFVHHLCLTRSTSCLKRLNFKDCEIPDSDSAAIIAQLPASCNDLTFYSSRFGPLSIAALAAAPQRDFSLTLTRGIPSRLIHGLLSSCSNLQYLLSSCQVIAIDLLAAPWVASRLVKLDLTLLFVADLPPEMGHSVIYEQLSRLVSLQDLCLDQVIPLTEADLDILFPFTAKAPLLSSSSSSTGRVELEIEIPPEGLDFSLENGMGVLASLSQLRRLDLRALRVLRMGQPEALWMDTHWPALKSLYVRGLNHDIREQRTVLEFLGKKRPELKIAIGRPKGDS